jgi:hypothetical protein
MARVYRATFKCHLVNLALVMPSLHYQTDVPPLGDEPDPNDVADGIWTLLGSAALAAMPGEVHCDELVVTEEVLPPDVGVAGAHTVGLNGTLPGGTGAELPDGIAAIVNLHTGTRSRSSRGWTIWPGPSSSSHVDHNTFTGAYLSAILAFAALLDDSFDLGSVTPTHVNPVVYSKTRRQREEDPYTFRVTSASVNRTTHWLRSRMDVP